MSSNADDVVAGAAMRDAIIDVLVSRACVSSKGELRSRPVTRRQLLLSIQPLWQSSVFASTSEATETLIGVTLQKMCNANEVRNVNSEIENVESSFSLCNETLKKLKQSLIEGNGRKATEEKKEDPQTSDATASKGIGSSIQNALRERISARNPQRKSSSKSSNLGSRQHRAIAIKKKRKKVSVAKKEKRSGDKLRRAMKKAAVTKRQLCARRK